MATSETGPKPKLKPTETHPTRNPVQRSRRSQAAFTLIEMMAVLMIFAGIAAIFVPQVGSITGRKLQQRAVDMASQLELARQRAVLTGVPHRVLLDLDDSGYRIEWWTTNPEEDETEPEGSLDLRGFGPLPLEAPRGAEQAWHPMPGLSGRFVWLEDELTIAGVETAGEWVDHGDVPVEFDWNGTTAATTVHIDDETGRQLVLDVMPLAEGVRITDEG